MRPPITPQTPSALDLLRQAVVEARTALPYTERTPVGMIEPTHRIPKAPLAGVRIPLSARLPSIERTDREGFEGVLSEAIRPAGETVTLRSAVTASSRAVQAGAHLIAETPARKIPNNNQQAPALQLVPSGLRLVKPAKFSWLVNDDPVTPSELASIVKEAKTQRSDDLQVYGFRVSMTRKDQRDVEDDRLLSEALDAIAMGVGRAVDMELFYKIGAARPVGDDTAVFSMARAAAAGVKFEDLKALVGGGEIVGIAPTGDAGKLFVSGVQAELSDVMAETVGNGSIIAAWSRFGVVIADSMEILVQRDSPDGSITLTAWIGLNAAIPDISYAWLV